MDRNIKNRLYISTIASDCREEAVKYGLGLEIADFCYALNLDVNKEHYLKEVRFKMQGLERFCFHAPFAELAACAIDPKARELTAYRYMQSIETAGELGIKRLVIHGGYIPFVYFPQSYVPQSVLFWKEFLRKVPDDVSIMLENVMEPDPCMLIDIVKQVSDKRLGLCLDVGHANCIVSKLPPIDWIEPMLPYLKHVHLHNNSGETDLHNALNDGNIPMEKVLDKLISLSDDITFVIENQLCAPSVSWLAEKGYLGLNSINNKQ